MKTNDMINVVIVDDQALLRKSLSKIISMNENITVVGEGETGLDAIKLCENNKPHIVLLDIQMPIMDGITALRAIKNKHEDVKVIILTTFEDRKNIIEGFLADADGYITKDIEPEEVITTIKCVNHGLTVINKSVKKIMVNKFRKISKLTKNYVDILSIEEIEMVKLIVDGKSNKELSNVLNYTEGTIKNKVSKIYEKLNISDRLKLAVYAVENGIE